MSFEIRNDRTDLAIKLVHQAAERAAGVALEFLLEEANRTVPIEESTLEKSGSTDVEGTKGRVGYNTAYARRQHEDTRLRHDPGRRAKWLQLTAEEQISKVRAIYEQELSEAVS